MADPKDEQIAKLQAQVQDLKIKITELGECRSKLCQESYRDIYQMELLAKRTREKMYLWRERANTLEILLREIAYNVQKTVDVGCPIDEQDRSVLDETEFSRKRPRREQRIKEFDEKLQDIANDVKCRAMQGGEV